MGSRRDPVPTYTLPLSVNLIGETVTITCGKPRTEPVSMDEPVRDEQGDEDRMPAFGMWRDREDMADVEAHVRELRKGRQLVG